MKPEENFLDVKPLFFTYPPRPYPYVLINANRPQFSMLKYAKKVIIDSGVEIFRDRNVKDYPKDHMNKILRIYFYVKRNYNVDVHVVCPDYPDDYHPKSLWINDEYTNIERTIDNVVKCLEKYPYVNWIIVIQGHNKDPSSVYRSIKLYDELGILRERDYFAVGNLCVENNTKIIYETVRNVYKTLSDKKIHVFGLKLNALRKVMTMIYSFDSFAWSMAVDTSLKKTFKDNLKGGYQANNQLQRIKFFEKWLEKYYKIISLGKTLF
jgi:hypothetical protein